MISDRIGLPAAPTTSITIETPTAIRTRIDNGRIQRARSLESTKPSAPMPITVSAVPPAACVRIAGWFAVK
jgi:hypothetical protein